MKYFRNIIMIVIISALLAIGLNHYTQRPMDKEPLLSIGAAQFSLEELETKIKKNPYAYTDRSYFVDSVIDRELLLQEAQRQRLDQEPAFARAMQDFLEQSLVRNVTDRYYASLKPVVTAAQIDRYLHWQNKSFKLQIFDYEDNQHAEADQFLSQQIIDGKYCVLPPTVREAIATTPVGELCTPIQLNDQLVRVRIVAENADTVSSQSNMDRAAVESKLLQEQKSQMMEQWLQQLREHATVISSDQLERWKQHEN